MRLSVSMEAIDATLARARTLERAEYRLQWRDRMNRGMFSEAGELTGKAFHRGTISAIEGLADIEAVKIALELNEQKIRN